MITSYCSEAMAEAFAYLETQWCVRMVAAESNPVVPFRVPLFLGNSRIFSEVRSTVSRCCDFFWQLKYTLVTLRNRNNAFSSSTSTCGDILWSLLTSTEQRSQLKKKKKKTFWRTLNSVGWQEICQNHAYSLRNYLLIGIRFSQTNFFHDQLPNLTRMLMQIVNSWADGFWFPLWVLSFTNLTWSVQNTHLNHNQLS